MRLFFLVLGIVIAASLPVSAETKITEYYTLIADHDLQNSRGVPINDFCGYVQQDRANYHRFGKRHEFDQIDPIFFSREMRAQIAATCQLGAGSEYLPESLKTYGSKYIRVEVFGEGNRLTRVVVSEGAG